MNRSLTPAICLVSLASMIAAGTSHWWSVRQFVTVFDASPPVPGRSAPQTLMPQKSKATEPKSPAEIPDLATAQQPAAPAQQTAAVQPAAVQPDGETVAMQQQFYQELIREMQTLRTQNRDLLNQVAETNRDLMKLEFRVDTHSEQFRPLPVGEDTFGTTFGTSFDDSPGLLPPRAEPVSPTFTE